MTVYLFCQSQEQQTKIKHIYNFADVSLRSWFPKLPSYAAFNNRLNRFSEVFHLLTASILRTQQPADCFIDMSLLDSLPIITFSGKRVSKVASELTEKGYWAAKSWYCYVLKLHALTFHLEKQLLFPEQLFLTPASENVLIVFRTAGSDIENRQFFDNKIYPDHDFFGWLSTTKNAVIVTLVKGIKIQSKWVKQHNRAAAELFSKAVSKVRQTMKRFFYWLIEKTDFFY